MLDLFFLLIVVLGGATAASAAVRIGQHTVRESRSRRRVRRRLEQLRHLH